MTNDAAQRPMTNDFAPRRSMNDVPISFEPPRGMRDFYPEDMVWRNRVFATDSAVSKSARSSGRTWPL